MGLRIIGQILAVAIAVGCGMAVILIAPFLIAGETEEHVDAPVKTQGRKGPSLSGMTAEFFAMPADRGTRVPACPSSETPDPDCARDTAQQFCRGAGYSYVGNLAMETVEGRVYLADVLCKHSAVAITW
jgi:hypothetical protein